MKVRNRRKLIANCNPGQIRCADTGRCGPGLGVDVPRNRMPQVRGEDVAEFVDWARGKGVGVDETSVVADDLSPTQREFRQERVDAIPDDKLSDPVVVSRDGYVLDGTHRWVKQWQRNRWAKVPVLKIDLDLRPALDLMRSFPKARFVENYDPDQSRNPDGTWGDGGGTIKDKNDKEYNVKWDGDRTYDISEKDAPRGVTAGGLTLKRDKTGVMSVGIHGEHQRKGLASALYDHVEKHLGYPLKENWGTTPDGEAFWKARKSRMTKNSRNPMRFDPTRTKTLRRAFVAVVRRRYSSMKAAVLKLVADGDAFGLTRNADDWSLSQTPDQVRRFREWVRRQIAEKIRGLTNDQLWDRYVNAGLKKGAGRAYDDWRRSNPGAADEPMDFYRGSRDQFVKSSFNQPVAKEKVQLLAARTFDELDNIDSDMSTKMSRALTDGLVQGKGRDDVARDIVKQVGISQQRAEAVAQTELIRAHAEGQLLAFDLLGVEDLGVAVEWSTAHDDAVCEQCEPLEGVVLKVDEARGMIPRHVNCFTSARVPIYTADGWKPISDVKVGDLVLTHVGRFREVLQTHRNMGVGEGVVEFGIGACNEKITVTDGHPVLVNKVWRDASAIKVGSWVRWMKADCGGCGKSIPFGKRYCNQKCQWKNKDHRDNMSKKTSAQLLREYADGTRDGREITKAAHAKTAELGYRWLHSFNARANRRWSEDTRKRLRQSKIGGNNPMRIHRSLGKRNGQILAQFIKDNPEKHVNHIMAAAGHKTGIERKMGEALIKVGLVDAVFNYPTIGLWIDYAFVDRKIAVECDGAYWHKDKEKDRRRDDRLRAEGWTVVRFDEKSILRDAGRCAEYVARLVNNHDGEYRFTDFRIVSVTRRKTGRVVLYNLSVAEDESYVAKGCVVHNCRCAWIPANVGESDKDQKDTKGSILDSFKVSIESGGKNDDWGPGQKISKDRPESLIGNRSVGVLSSFLAETT